MGEGAPREMAYKIFQNKVSYLPTSQFSFGLQNPAYIFLTDVESLTQWMALMNQTLCKRISGFKKKIQIKNRVRFDTLNSICIAFHK